MRLFKVIARVQDMPEPKFYGCIDGSMGTEIEMTLDDALGASHSGQCDDDVAALAQEPEIAKQLDEIGPDKLRLACKETGAWEPDELADNDANRLRAVWMAAGDIRDNASERLSELGDKAVEYLNELETRPGMYWCFEDNSLFLMSDSEQA